jgi:hypothetical protein
MAANLVFLGKQYAAYVTVLVGQQDGPLIYIDSHGHIHGPIPEGPEGKALLSAVEQHSRALDGALSQIAAVAAKAS